MSYSVRSGDTLSGIASQNGVSLAALEAANPSIANPNLSHVGESINIPGSSDSFQSTPASSSSGPAPKFYTVQSGDTMSGIASKYGVSLGALENANPQASNPNDIYPGQALSIPGGTSSPAPTPAPSTSSSSGGSYTVRSGDTMSGIASQHGVSLSALEAANPQVSNPNVISVGETLHLPAGASASTSTSSSSPVGGNVGSWIAQAQSILEAAGVPLSEMPASDINTIIQHESSGDPNAVNNWDSNAAAGTPSEGLMQTIGPTFNEWALPGHTDIFNPVDNIIAGVRYAIDRYGSIQNVPGVVAVNEGQPYVGY